VNLLTPAQVAELLQVSVRTVMRHAKALGGIYPAGIKCLRFRAEDVERACLRGGGLSVDQQVVKRRGPDLDPGRHGL
jgi:hypothetical protein